MTNNRKHPQNAKRHKRMTATDWYQRLDDAINTHFMTGMDFRPDALKLIRAIQAQARATWQSEARLLRLTAHDLLEALTEQTEAAQAVLDCWERGNLAGAVCRLDGTVAAARSAIAKAKGGAA